MHSVIKKENNKMSPHQVILLLGYKKPPITDGQYSIKN